MSQRTEMIGGSTQELEGLTDDRPLRRDAEQNLSRVVSAARDVFAEHGYEASMEQIAARADVGIGTLYRRFPNKADLFAAVVDAASERTRMIADEVLAEAAPPDAVFEFVRRCVAAPSCWRAMTSRRPWNEGREERALAHLLPVIGQILTASQNAGAAREDVSPTDVVVLLMSVRAVADLCDADAPSASRRFLDLALDGMRTRQTPTTRPPVTAKQLGRLLTTRQNPPVSG